MSKPRKYSPLIVESPVGDLPDEEFSGSTTGATMHVARFGTKVRASIVVLLSLGMLAVGAPAFGSDVDDQGDSGLAVVAEHEVGAEP
ncbi:MAG: hypothetical protein LBH13_01435, partial [Cellulomonadaceae bacterium]|nr:hypothetical protein [Cellulomonadaceae bacterium]